MTNITITFENPAHNHSTDDADAALDAFIAKHNLTDDDVIAIWSDSEHPLFSDLDTAITLAATRGWRRPIEFSGYRLIA